MVGVKKAANQPALSPHSRQATRPTKMIEIKNEMAATKWGAHTAEGLIAKAIK